jgi:hypothetical protein
MRPLRAAWLVLFLCAAAPRPGAAAVNVERSSSENPMVEVARSTIYGGLTGLLLGGALALAVDDNKDSDYLKWGFVAGTFFGFGYGLQNVATRPSAQALLEIDGGAPAWRVPEIAVGDHGALRASLVTARF